MAKLKNHTLICRKASQIRARATILAMDIATRLMPLALEVDGFNKLATLFREADTLRDLQFATMVADYADFESELGRLMQVMDDSVTALMDGGRNWDAWDAMPADIWEQWGKEYKTREIKLFNAVHAGLCDIARVLKCLSPK